MRDLAPADAPQEGMKHHKLVVALNVIFLRKRNKEADCAGDVLSMKSSRPCQQELVSLSLVLELSVSLCGGGKYVNRSEKIVDKISKVNPHHDVHHFL